MSDTTVWRWLHEDAIRPWRHRTWIFPRDPDFARKAGRILDLYARCWDGAPLTTDALVISADEKTSIQARLRTHPYYERIATPFEWRFTKDDLAALLKKLAGHGTALPVAA